jgi:hypothetical protein
VLLAGMSAKSAGTRGWRPQEWEMATILELRRVTNRPIMYRPKPSWLDATPISGTQFSPRDELVTDALKNCWAVVTLHSNVAIDALLAGIPIHALEGVAAGFSQPLEQIETFRLDGNREQLMADIAWCQWKASEMADGSAWRYLLERTPLCG